MNSDEDLIDTHNAREELREAAEWKRNTETQQQYGNAAKKAHKVRMAGCLLRHFPVPSWDDMNIGSQRHLIADAENVAKNPSLTATELRKLYQERLMAWGDTENADLGVDDETTPARQEIEEAVLKHLRSVLLTPEPLAKG